MTRSKQAVSASVPPRTSRPALRHARRPSGMGIVRGHAAQSLQVGGRMAAVSYGQGQAVLDSARPSLQGHLAEHIPCLMCRRATEMLDEQQTRRADAARSSR